MAVRSESMSPVVSAAISSATRPTLWTASPNGTVSGRTVRARRVDVELAGHQTTTSIDVAIGTRIVRPPAETQHPPYADGAALSGWVSMAEPTRKAASTSPLAAKAPATTAAPLKPRPRPGGIGLLHHNGPSPPHRAKAIDAGCPCSARRNPAPGSRSPTINSNGMSNASPSASNPGPRLADEAGAMTCTRSP